MADRQDRWQTGGRRRSASFFLLVYLLAFARFPSSSRFFSSFFPGSGRRSMRRSVVGMRFLLVVLCFGAHGTVAFNVGYASVLFSRSTPPLQASRASIAPLAVLPLLRGHGKSRSLQVGTFRRHDVATKGAVGNGQDKGKGADKDDDKLPPAVLPICLGVFVQMLGEGIVISSIPLHLKSFGATAVQVGLATSAFSIAQMVCCPLIVKLSNRIGRTVVLRMCLAGATAASFVITLSPTINGVILGRFLAGIFAASVPVAQAGVTDLVSGSKSALALSRVASANQMGIVIGPAMSAVLAYLFGVCGLATHLQMRAVFFVSGLFALSVLIIDNLQAPFTPAAVEKAEAERYAFVRAPGRSRLPLLSLSLSLSLCVCVCV